MGGYRQLPITPYNPPDPLEQQQKVEHLKSLRQAQVMQQQQMQQNQMQLQQQQQDMKDQQAANAAMQDWDGKDINELPNLMKRRGASAKAVMAARSGLMKQFHDMVTMAKSQNDADKAKWETEKIKNDYFAQAVANVKALPPEQQPQGFEAAKANAVQRGYLDPKQAQGLQYQGPQQLDLLEKQYMGHANAQKAADEQAKIKDLSEQRAAQQENMKEQRRLQERGQDIQLRGQDMVDARARELKQATEAGSYMALTDDKGNVIGAWNPKTETFKPAPKEGLRKSGLSSTERAELASFDVLNGQLERLKTTVEAHKDAVGVVAGRLGTTRAATIGGNDEHASIYQTIQDINNQIVYLRSGKQINEQEYVRLRKAMPNENLPYSTFMVRLKNITNTLDELQKRRKSPTGQPGSPAPKADPLGIR